MTGTTIGLLNSRRPADPTTGNSDIGRVKERDALGTPLVEPNLRAAIGWATRPASCLEFFLNFHEVSCSPGLSSPIGVSSS
jgi:hypothetical protein